MKPTAAELLLFIERNKLEINPPEDESPYWVVYDEKHQLGYGIGFGRTLIEALEKAYLIKNK